MEASVARLGLRLTITQPVPKTLGAVSITLCSLLRGVLPLATARIYVRYVATAIRELATAMASACRRTAVIGEVRQNRGYERACRAG
jgi:hypothetical protein